MNVVSFKVVWKAIVDAFDVRDRRVGYVIGTGASTSMAPTAHGAGSLQVDIASGNYSKNGADASTAYAGGNITLTAADGTNPRVDIVYMSSGGTLSKTDGTAAAIVVGVSGPVPPAWPAGCCPLAICFVPATATDFTTGGYVLDARPFGVVPSAGGGGTPALTLGTANAAGAATTFIRDDDTILAFDVTAPTTSAVGDAATVGVATTTARRDHLHGREAFVTPAIVLGSAAAAGAATTLIRSDGTIAAFDATLPALIGVSAVGVAAKAARRDHVHDESLIYYETYLSTHAIDTTNKVVNVSGGTTTLDQSGIVMATSGTANSSTLIILPMGIGFAATEGFEKFIRFKTHLAMRTSITNETFWCGMNDGAVTPTTTLRHYMWRYDSAKSANWFLTVANGTTESTADSGVAVITTAPVTLAITFDGTTVTGYINGVSKGTITTNLPTGSPNFVTAMWYVDNKTDAVNKTVEVGTGMVRMTM